MTDEELAVYKQEKEAQLKKDEEAKAMLKQLEEGDLPQSYDYVSFGYYDKFTQTKSVSKEDAIKGYVP